MNELFDAEAHERHMQAIDRARLFLDVDDYEWAFQQISSLPPVYQELPLALQVRLLYHSRMGEPEKAWPCVERLVAMHPDDDEVESYHIGILMDLGRMDEALAELKQALLRYPRSSFILLELCRFYAREQQIPKARLALERAIQLDDSGNVQKIAVADPLLEDVVTG